MIFFRYLSILCYLTVYIHLFILPPTETVICQVLQPPHFSSQGQKVWDPSFQAEESAEHKDVVVTALLPEGLYRAAATLSCSLIVFLHPPPPRGLSQALFAGVRHSLALLCRDEGRSARLTSSSPLSSCWHFPFHSSFVPRSVISAGTDLICAEETNLIIVLY